MPGRTVNYESSIRIMGLPLVAVARNPPGQKRAVARGIIAVGDEAQGVIAIGGVACGGVAIGGFACGVFAIGGVAVGALAIAGVALGCGAFGGVAAGYFARGGVAVGRHAMSPSQSDPAAVDFFGRVLPGRRNRS